MSEQLSKHIDTESAERILREFEKEHGSVIGSTLEGFKLLFEIIAFAYEQGRNDEVNK